MRHIKSLAILLIFGLLCFSSCKSDSNTAETIIPSTGSLADLQNAYKADPNKATAERLIQELIKVSSDKNISANDRKSNLLKGLEIAESQNIIKRQASFLFPLVKDYINDPGTANRIDKLAAAMAKMNKTSVANVLRKGLIDNYSNYKGIEDVKTALVDPIENIDDYIKNLGEKIFVDPDNTGINREASLSYVDACEAYAAVYQDTPFAPENLFKAAEVAKSIRTFPKSLSLYDWILEKYPEYEKAPTALFLKGFIIENNLGNDEQAKVFYEEFLRRFPQHDLADDVEFLIENLGKSDAEILEMIEKKAAEKKGNQ